MAAEKAIACPLLEGANLQGARGMLVYFTGDESLTLAEIREAMGVLNTFVAKQANVIFGSAISEEMGDEVRVTVVATGLDNPFDPASPDDGSGQPGMPNMGAGFTNPAAAPDIPTYSAPTLNDIGRGAQQQPAGDAAQQPPAQNPGEPAAIPSAGGYAIPTYLRTSGS